MSLYPMLTGLALLLPASLPQSSQTATASRLISYTELMQEVKRNKGKVIVVDLWTDG